MKSWKFALTLSLIFYTTKAEEGPLMQNLTCSTDYESHTTCTWFEHQEAMDLVNMTLLHKSNYLNLTKLACTSQKIGSWIRWDCRRNQIIFNINVNNTFIFKPEQNLEIQQNISLFDNSEIEAQPKNLHCQFNGIDRLICSWEVRKEVTRSVLFALFYKGSTESKEEECFPVDERRVSINSQGTSPQHVVQSCEINVTDPQRQSRYLVTVRPKEEEKVVKAAKQIKPKPPYNLSVTILNSQEYQLKWQPQIVLNIPQTYQILYWKTGSPLEAKYVNVNDGNQWFIFTTDILEPGTSYAAMVRATVHSDFYEGPWSDWSMEFHWTTLKGFPFWVIPLITMSSVILIWCCYKYICRKEKEWEARIPSPPKMFLHPNFFQKVELLDSSEGNSSSRTLLEVDSIGYTEDLQREMLGTSPVSLQDELGKTEQLSIASQNRVREVPSKGSMGHFLTQSIKDNRLVSSPKAQIFDFDGPYLCSPPKSFPSTIWQGRDAAPSELKETSAGLENVGLLHCLDSQQMPVEKGERMPPSISIIHDEYQEEKQLPSARQKESQSNKLENDGNNDRELRNVAGTNSPCQKGFLNYLAMEDLIISKDLGSSLPVPAVASKEGRPTCDSMATGTPGTTESLSSLEMPGKKPESGLPPPSESLAVPLAASQTQFGDYVRDLPAPTGFAPKEGLALSADEPKPDKVFLIFHHPDSRSPIFLSQVGGYCFFPGSKPIKEACKSQWGKGDCHLSQASQEGRKSPIKKKVESNMLQKPTAAAKF
ncbi:hypothetical protein JRQ81_016309 [Phrynocephalus forsythii]|uniref:Fibronectin type-III domain-containing protein n=1 Tax=Phrynocephalus forsythii TaxID=171643 RepID=A0A9Q0XWI6_9SAUR|nr:hypothetical protein JRQ81_016309 [Phrynocephalus forsythii]